MNITRSSRRDFLRLSALGLSLPAAGSAWLPFAHKEQTRPASKNLLVTDIKVYKVKVNQRGNWVFVELKTGGGMTGVGEASHGMTAAGGEDRLQQEIEAFFAMVKGESSFSIEQYRQRGWRRAQTERISATAFSAVEQALWDINGKTLGVPVHALLGGKIRDKVKAYANINRATNEKDANGRRPAQAFQKNAALALEQGFRAIKMAPFDEMKPLPSTPKQIEADVDHAIRCIEAVRQTIGSDVDLLVDVHSHLDHDLGIAVAKRVEPFDLFWFEEPVNPGKFVAETKAISDATAKTTAGGESIFGREGFAALIHEKALDILMPDVKHCGGILELKYIAAMAETAGLRVAPHNPSGPIATAASVQAVATIPNFTILEMAYGEVPWRSSIVAPSETFVDGHITVSNEPGLGYQLNHRELAKYAI